MIKGLKDKIGEKRLKNALKMHVRQKEFLNIEQIHSIGIVFDATNSSDFEQVKTYVNKLKQQGKRVHAIGFYDTKLIPENLSYSKSDFDLFCLKDLDKANTPNKPYIMTFITELRDLLIDLNFQNKFPLRFIAGMSYAKFKIGISIPENQLIHDMMISVDPEAGVKKFLEQTDVYLQMMNRA